MDRLVDGKYVVTDVVTVRKHHRPARIVCLHVFRLVRLSFICRHV